MEAARIIQQLHDLEERAVELDKMRTSTISSISYINDRNRKRNVEEAEKAIMVVFETIILFYHFFMALGQSFLMDFVASLNMDGKKLYLKGKPID